MYRAGVVAATVSNVAPRKKGAKPLKPSDFYPNQKPRVSPRLIRALRERRKNGQRRNGHS